MPDMLMKWTLRILPVGYIGLIWLQSSLFDPASVESTPGLGSILELGHLILFAILYILIIIAVSTYGRITLKKEMIIVSLTFLCALVDELHQYYVPFRSASLIDIWKDGIGILVAWYMFRIFAKFTGSRRYN